VGKGLQRLIFLGLLLCAQAALAADIVFTDGKVAHNVTIVFQDASSVGVHTPSGLLRYPRSKIKSIEETQPAAVAEPSPIPSATPIATPTPGAIPDAPPTGASSATAAAPVESPSAAAATPTGTQENPTAAATTPQTIAEPPPSPPHEHRWNFEWFLLALLAGGAIWIRSLQWVQQDLFQRRIDPRLWTLVALLLPGLGAAIYAVAFRVADLLERRRSKTDAPATTAPQQDAPRDPASHLAARGATRRGFEFLDTERKSVASNADREISSGLDHAGEMIEEALLEKASDVHIEPGPDGYRVRFRLDGVLHERMSYGTLDGRRVVTSLKTLAQIDVAEKRKAQDGHFRVRADGREVDFRVATANSIHGEKMVIRILDHSHSVFDLTALGMSAEMLETFRGVVHSRNGIILATGPTGSGKTSTLYAALRELDARSKNIMTIEDPPEYELAGATQLAVNPRAGITYGSGLRSILRQDPDVILVGEMRDTEAAGVAITAALTGHLVLSSLHTQNAVGTISRLQDMGIERYQVASALRMVLAQRLVRVLCEHCRQPYAALGNELEDIGMGFEPGSILYTPAGCEQCLGTGFRGRTGLFELLVMDDDLRRAVSEGSGEAELEAMTAERGFRTYRYDGAEKVLLGITTVEEVLQAV